MEVSGQYLPGNSVNARQFLSKSLLILQQWLIHSLVDERVSIWSGCRGSQGESFYSSVIILPSLRRFWRNGSLCMSNIIQGITQQYPVPWTHPLSFPVSLYILKHLRIHVTWSALSNRCHLNHSVMKTSCHQKIMTAGRLLRSCSMAPRHGRLRMSNLGCIHCGICHKWASAASSSLPLCKQVRHSRASLVAAVLKSLVQWCMVCGTSAVLPGCNHSSMGWICMPTV